MEKGQKDWAQEIEYLMKNKKHYSEKQIFIILKQLTSGLSFLQKNNIAHRDVKPHNILVFPNNLYKIADFSEAISLIQNRGGQTGVTRGSELFMSPLLYQGLINNKNYIKNNPFKSDVFSLGYSILYAMTLKIDFLNYIRKIKDIEKIINKNFKKDYPTITNIVINMVKYEEKDRYDFQQLEKELNKINIKELN